MVGIRRSDHQCIRIGDGRYEYAGIASRNDDHLVSYASSVEHNGQIGRLERFSQPSRIDSKPLLGAVGGKDKKKNIPVAVHLLCLRLQCCSKRFDGRIAAGLVLNRTTTGSAPNRFATISAAPVASLRKTP